LAHLVELTDKRFNAIKANLLIQFIHKLLVVHGQVGVSIAQIVQNVSKVRSVSVYKVATICICGDIMAS